MLLNIKELEDNTFEYEGGIGRVTEEVFHATLKGQLKIKRYQLKKALLAERSKPKTYPPRPLNQFDKVDFRLSEIKRGGDVEGEPSTS